MYLKEGLYNGSAPPCSADYQPSLYGPRQKVNGPPRRYPHGLAQGVDAAEPPTGSGEPRPEDFGEDLRKLRDDVRRLQEQVDAIATARARQESARLPTYVQGFDGAIEGGIPRGHVVLLTGPTGAMKTSLALNLLTKNRAAGVHGVYVTVEEARESIVETMRRLGLGDSEDFIVDVARLRLERAAAEEVHDWMQVLRDFFTRRRQRDPLGIVVIDSLNALTALARVEDVRSELFHFLNFLRSLGVTTILVSERDPDASRAPQETDVDFLADGILELRFSGAGRGRVQLLLRCAKMRHTRHSRDYFDVRYENGRFIARPYEEPRRRWGRRG